jgi:hypothetical protein
MDGDARDAVGHQRIGPPQAHIGDADFGQHQSVSCLCDDSKRQQEPVKKIEYGNRSHFVSPFSPERMTATDLVWQVSWLVPLLGRPSHTDEIGTVAKGCLARYWNVQLRVQPPI